MKLLLWDIDGTILSTNGAARRAFHFALLDVFGMTGPIEAHDFSGKTDPQIARELLRLAGFGDAAIDARLPSLWASYLGALESELAAPDQRSSTMPGVREVLDALAGAQQQAVVALLTGNIEPGAALKLRSVALADRFAFGAYGSDSERRSELPALAVERARSHTGREFRGRDVVVIGDTPHDVTCGRALGVTAVGVATGRHDEAALRAAGAH
ncbi:MAG: HAD family hydrolase, partial [Longimicrobiales bacterium]